MLRFWAIDEKTLIVTFAVLISPFIGSFLGLAAVRMPLGERVVLGRSRCRVCANTLTFQDLIPIVSWVASRGRCRHCRARYAVFYPAMEISALTIAAWGAIVVPTSLVFAGTCVFGWTLLVLAVIDWRNHWLPDRLTFFTLATGLLFTYCISPSKLLDHVIGATAGMVLFVLIAWIYRAARGREGLGMGDAKLLGGIGAWVSWAGIPSVVLIAAVSALSVALASRVTGTAVGMQDRVPLGAYLAGAAWLVWLYGPLWVA